MDKQFYNVSYSGLDKDRIHMQHYIRKQEHKVDHIYLDTDNLFKSNRDIDVDFASVNGKLIPGMFVQIGDIC